MKKIMIGIMTMHCVPNYGAIMQAYATKRIFETELKKQKYSLKTEIKIVDYQPLNKRMKYSDSALFLYTILHPRSCIKSMRLLCSKSRSALKRLHDNAYRFYYEHNLLSRKISKKNLALLGDICDAVIIGSDQVWNPYGMEKENPYICSFSDKMLKFSFSSSFGIKNFPEKYAGVYRRNLLKFNSISVREKEGLDIIEELTGRTDCIQTLDPSMMLSKEEYKVIEDKRLATSLPHGYVLVYMAMKSDTLLEFVLQHVDKETMVAILGMPEVLADIQCKDDRVRIFQSINPEEFLGFFDLADVIYTNSFHGIAFSLIFEKQFFIEYNDKFSNSNSRLENIVERYGLESRLIANNPKDILSYEYIENIIKEEKESTEQYIKKILQIMTNEQ